MGLQYGRFRAAAFIAGLTLSTAGAGTALAVDVAASDVVADAVVTVTWVDADDGPMTGAIVRVSWYHEGDSSPTALPNAVADAAGRAVIADVPRPADGADPVLLDIRGERAASTIDENGCTELASWVASSNGIEAAATVEVALETDLESVSVSCPEPTPTDAVDPTPTPTASSTPAPTASPSGGVLGTTGTPGVTPPSTDTVADPGPRGGSPFLPSLVALLGLAIGLVPVTSLAHARARSRPRRRPVLGGVVAKRLAPAEGEPQWPTSPFAER